MSSILGGLLAGVLAAAVILAGAGAWRRLTNWSIQRRRQIFRFWDGATIRGVDPLHAVRALRADPEYVDTQHLPLVDAGDDDAIRISAAATRRAFGLAEVSAGGLSDLECLSVLTQFLKFLLHVKKNTARPRNSPELTGPQSSDESTTKPLSESGSTSIESTPAEQGAS